MLKTIILFKKKDNHKKTKSLMVIQYAIVRGTEKLGTARCIEAEQHSEMRKLELDFAGKTGVGVEKLAEHLNEHGRNFGFTAEEEYLQAAKKFLKKRKKRS